MTMFKIIPCYYSYKSEGIVRCGYSLYQRTSYFMVHGSHHLLFLVHLPPPPPPPPWSWIYGRAAAGEGKQAAAKLAAWTSSSSCFFQRRLWFRVRYSETYRPDPDTKIWSGDYRLFRRGRATAPLCGCLSSSCCHWLPGPHAASLLQWCYPSICRAR